MSTASRHALVLVLLAATMAATRIHHFGVVPDASWAVFFIGGVYLRDVARWAFPALLGLAVAIDALVIRSQGLSFWDHYCVSPAYWCLAPAYFSLWAGGSWLARRNATAPRGTLATGARAAACLVAGVAACHLLAQGSFYWFGGTVATPDLAGWWKNYRDWLPAYLGAAALYAGAAAALHAVVVQASGRTRRAIAR